MTTSEAMKIQKSVLIHATRSRVWKALTTAREFSNWFAADLNGSFEPGKRIDLISTHPASNGQAFYFIIERMEPEQKFSWRWHPGSATQEDGTTLVEFDLEEVPEGTLVTVTETGFDRISIARRAKAFEENQIGWDLELDSLKEYVRQAV